MMEPRTAASSDGSLMRDLLHAARYYLGNRRVLAVLAGATAVVALTFNWNWLVAAGVAPLLVAALPCAAMCALGLCMNKAAGRSCDSKAIPRAPDTKIEEKR